MKYLKALIVVIITVFTFGSAMAQTRPHHHPHHRHYPHHRRHPHHRPVHHHPVHH